MLASDGKVFTLEAAKLPGGRGFGEPIRLMVDIGEREEIVAVLPFAGGTKMLIASSDGRGFVVAQDDLASSTRKGRAVLGVDAPARARLLVPALGDHVAIIGDNRKLLLFPLAQIPEMTRGKGVRLQRYKEGVVSDAKVFAFKNGLTWRGQRGAALHALGATTCATGWARGAKPVACRRKAFQRPTRLDERDGSQAARRYSASLA